MSKYKSQLGHVLILGVAVVAATLACQGPSEAGEPPGTDCCWDTLPKNCNDCTELDGFPGNYVYCNYSFQMRQCPFHYFEDGICSSPGEIFCGQGYLSSNSNCEDASPSFNCYTSETAIGSRCLGI